MTCLMRVSLRMVPEKQRAKTPSMRFVRVALYLRWVIKKEASQLTSLIRVSLRMVPETRIELVRVAPHAPQTCVSTISTTPALNVGKYIKKSLFSQAFSRKFMVLFSLWT